MVTQRSSICLTLVLLATGGLAACKTAHWAMPHASKTLDCPKDQIVFTRDVEPFFHHIEGCGRTDDIMELCSPSGECKVNVVSDLLKHAEFELGCKELEATRIDKDTMGVSGCDQRAVYKGTFTGWILNSASEPSAKPDEVEPASEEPTPPEPPRGE